MSDTERYSSICKVGLSHTFRFLALNEANEELDIGDIDIAVRYHYGQWKHFMQVEETSNPAAIAHGAYGACSGSAGYVDNSRGRRVGLEGLVTVTVASPAAGDEVKVYLQHSPDGGTTWPDDGNGDLLATVDCSASPAIQKISY